MKAARTYCLRNNTEKDLILADLNIKIPAWTEKINIFRLNPKLTQELIRVSERTGSLATCFKNNKLVKVASDALPVVPFTNNIKESLKAIPSRSKSSVVMAIIDTDYIKELTGQFTENDMSNFESIAEGFSDPMADVAEEEVVLEAEYFEPEKVAQIIDERYAPTGILLNYINKKQ